MIEISSRIDGNDLSYDVRSAMKYGDMVIFEAFRMCQIAPNLQRRATGPYVLENGNGDTVTIQPGDAVWLPAHILQNDPKYYPNPEMFDTERFSDENRKVQVAGTYAPFGLGPRDCIVRQLEMNDLMKMNDDLCLSAFIFCNFFSFL